jgi:hypothetical protein
MAMLEISWSRLAPITAKRWLPVALTCVAVAYMSLQAGEEASKLRDTLSSDLYEHARWNDFSMFYAGAELVTSDRRGELYDIDTMVSSILGVRDQSELPDKRPSSPQNMWLRYYNPPIYLAAFSPLTLLSLEDAYLAVMVLNVALLVCLCFVLGLVVRWQQPATLLLAIAILGFPGTRIALYHGQPTILIAALTGLGYVALRNRRLWTAGILLAFTGIKPHWLLPLLPLMSRKRRLILPILVAAAAFLALPYLLLGPSALVDYVGLVLARGQGDVTDSTYGIALLSWPGFFRTLTGEPQPALWLLASALTIVCFLALWRLGTAELGLAGGTLVALLVIPHSHPQDWVLLFTIAAILLSLDWEAPARYVLWGGLAVLYFAGTVYVEAYWELLDGEKVIYWLTPAAFGFLALLTALTLARRGPASAISDDAKGGTSASSPAMGRSLVS